MELEFFACSHSVVWRKMYITVCVVHKATAVMAIAYNMKYVHCKWQRYRMVVFPQFLLVFGLSYRNLMGKTCWRCWRTWNINSCWNWISHISVDKIYTYITSLLLPDAGFFCLVICHWHVFSITWQRKLSSTKEMWKWRWHTQLVHMCEWTNMVTHYRYAIQIQYDFAFPCSVGLHSFCVVASKKINILPLE